MGPARSKLFGDKRGSAQNEHRKFFTTHARCSHSLPFVITAAEIFLQPDIKADEDIPAAHFLDPKFCDTMPAIAPGDWDHGPGIAAHDCFERYFDREIEVRRDQRTATVDHSFAVGFECVGRVVQPDVEKYP